MIQNGIEPYGMLKLSERLKDDEKYVVPEFFSSHPVTDDRIQYIEEYIQNENYEMSNNAVLTGLFEELKSNI